MSTRLLLDQVVDGAGARVLVDRASDGAPRSARFDLSGLPRVDALLTGRPVAQVPALVERLCGLCPAAHHLAGVRALEALAGAGPVTPTADAVRRLLHHGSALDAHAVRLTPAAADAARTVRAFGRSAMAAAGSPGHFPTTAVPGGVLAAVTPEAHDTLLAEYQPALEAAVELAERVLAAAAVAPAGPGSHYPGADVALVDDAGRPDVLGALLRVVAADGAVVEPGAPATAWDGLVAEAAPGDAAPRPYLVPLGPDGGGYRVGPVAQLRVGTLTTPAAAELQERWHAAGGTALVARAVMTVHAVEAIGLLLGTVALVGGPVGEQVHVPPVAARGVGWVDGPRGLLVHRYAADERGLVVRATVLTPTAQNEPWLAGLLSGAAAITDDARAADAMESAIREADPCLPCTSAPVGAMDVTVEAVG